MTTERHVRFFRNGRNQALRIPREFELDAEEAIIRREDDRLIIEPVRKKGLLAGAPHQCSESRRQFAPGIEEYSGQQWRSPQ